MRRKVAFLGSGRVLGNVMQVNTSLALSPVTRTTATPHFPCPGRQIS